MLRLIGNILWFILGGALMGLWWWLAGLLCFVSIVGIPWGRACFVIGQLAFFPFGKEVVSRRELTGQEDVGTSEWGAVGNILWLVFVGIWLAIGHICWAVVDFITIIGIPFGLQHVKLAQLAIAPIGMAVVNREPARTARW